MVTIKIDEYGQILIPLEVNQQLNLQNNDWIKVSLKKDHILMIPLREADAELIEQLIDQGVFN